MKTDFRLGELFCGPGGLAVGAMRASVEAAGKTWKITPEWASDADYDTCATYAFNIHRGHEERVHHTPVEKLDFKKLPAIDAFAFGFPCNDYSVVGERKGVNGDYGALYRYGVKGLNHFEPKFFIAENVRGLTHSGHRETLNSMLKEFESAGDRGYNVISHLFKFEEYGVPQKRHRLIIVGIRKDFGLTFKVPAPITPHPDDWKTAGEALADLNPLLPNNWAEPLSEKVRKRLENTPEGHNCWSDAIPPEHRLTGVKGAWLSNIYRRLHSKQPSYTVTGTGGGGTHMYHWKEPRALTSREKARLQTFPNDHVFLGSRESVRRQVGMAVPPSAAKIIFEAILKTFAEVSYESVPASLGLKADSRMAVTSKESRRTAGAK